MEISLLHALQMFANELQDPHFSKKCQGQQSLPIHDLKSPLKWKLPTDFQRERFRKDIPAFLTYGENIYRIVVFMLTLLMPLSISTETQKI